MKRIRLATQSDIEAVIAIYDRIHGMEAEEKVRIGWMPGVYPVRATAEEALRRGDLFVYELEGVVVAFYEGYALREGCPILRLDTNAVNSIARRMYPSLGYREAGIVPCDFNGIPDIQLVLFEKSQVTIRFESER